MNQVLPNPGDEEPLGEDEYRNALRLAEAVLGWAEELTTHNDPQFTR